MLINNEKQSEKSDPASFKAALIPPCLTTAHRVVRIFISVSIRLRKYHPKPHPSCIGWSLTFHFVWQTLIFTSKVLSRWHPTHACPPHPHPPPPRRLSQGCFRRNCGNTNNPRPAKTTLTLARIKALPNVGHRWSFSISSSRGFTT